MRGWKSVRGQLALRCGGAMCRVAMFGGFSMLGGSCSGRRRTLCRSFALCRDIALCRGACFALCGRTGCFALCCGTGGLTLRGSAAIGQVTALEARHGRQQI